MKIMSNKEYQKLKDMERKYDELSGQTFTYCLGARSRRGALLQLSKEELVRRIFDLNNVCIQLQRKLKDSDISE